ncbi:uncharacterized protein LOC121715137 isoform X1 [Alosa sapidissima]|uniref:uncharacterized protein LOC121715137 isoform X1 n=3 Tax=Alosa sapidissima TaxID=34773 RepID=UPI001C0874FE|nr:uncharacterized protein LOC121715137 isoform X1 [Alosa sapidissima]
MFSRSTKVKMDKIYRLLEKHRLERLYKPFFDFGVRDERDFLDGIADEDLNSIGLTQVEKNRYKNMLDVIRRLGNGAEMTVTKSVEEFCLFYSFPKCPEARELRDLDPAQNTVEDLILRIGHQEGIDNSMGVCLFTAEGMPLTDDPFFNTWSLNDRHVEKGSHLYVIFTPKENLEMQRQTQIAWNNTGMDTVRCHIMLRGNYEIKIDLESQTLADLRQGLAHASGISPHVLHLRDVPWSDDPLKDIGINEESLVHFFLSSFNQECPSFDDFFMADIEPSVQQTVKGLSVFFSTLYSIRMKEHGEKSKNVVAYIRRLTGCHALAQILHQVMCRNETGTKVQKIVLVEGLYTLFRELLPSRTSQSCDMIVEDNEVFEYSAECWGYLFSQSQEETIEHENFAPMFLTCPTTGKRFSEAVRIANLPDICERSAVLQAIEDGEKMPNCSMEDMRQSIKKDTTMEKIILSIPPMMKTYPLWLSYAHVPGSNFRINPEMSFSQMKEGLDSYPHLQVTPPLQLKNGGVEAPCLINLSENSLGVYAQNPKGGEDVSIFNCLSGKQETVNLQKLAERLGDNRTDQSVRTTKTPKEAIMVLLDTSSSMSKECYSETKMRKLDAVKQLFYAFANRSMAYDFPHLISLVTFGTGVKIMHRFTENLEKFKEHVQSLQADGCTPLYDALAKSASELSKIRATFPECRLRVICLTDGNDEGSNSTAVSVVNKLLSNSIVVDGILVGEVVNNVLHGISNVTGGCCFKPDTSKMALKLFEMETVLSLESRKLKPKSTSAIQTEDELTTIFETLGYDVTPQVNLPPGIESKVVVTEDALKKKILESKTTRFMEKDRRIMEELKSLHCDPHPYCSVFPSDTDFTFWKILMQGPPETPYENGVFELYCQFGDSYPVKPPLVRFITPMYHCNINNVGRICHNIFDRNYSANITMREILNAVYGLLIAPEPDDPLDSVLAEEFMLNPDTYKEEAQKNTEVAAKTTMYDMEKKLLGSDAQQSFVPPHLICPLTKKMFVDPVKTTYGTAYERRAIENYLKETKTDPISGAALDENCLKPDTNIKCAVKNYRAEQIKD